MDFVSATLFGQAPGVRQHAPGFLEGILSDVLQSVIGRFVRGIDRDHLELSVWQGEVRLRDLELRTELLDALPLPQSGAAAASLVSLAWGCRWTAMCRAVARRH